MTERLKLIIYFLILFLWNIFLPANAMLQEDSLNSSLSVLRNELTTKHLKQQKQLNRSKIINEQVMKQLIGIGRKASQVSLMLYSQNNDNVFDLTYACNEATDLWKNFQTLTQPFKDIISNSKTDIARYDSLINVLSTMYVVGINKKANNDRIACLKLSISIKKMLIENNKIFTKYSNYYHYFEKTLYSINSYAQARYKEFQKSIFVKRGDNYFAFLNNIRVKSLQIKTSIEDKYSPSNNDNSQWGLNWIIGLFSMVLGYGIIAILFNYFFIKSFVTKILNKKRFAKLNKSFIAYRTCIIITASVIGFGLILIIIQFFSQSNFVNMACGLLLEFTWLLFVIFASLLLRVESKIIKITYRSYFPLIFIAFIVIAFRIIMLPNIIIQLTYPPLLLITCIWQLKTIHKFNKYLEKIDLRLNYCSMAVFVFGVVSAWIGYIYLSVQIIIWWTMQLACLLTITCIYEYLYLYGKKKDLKNKIITQTWLYKFVYYVLIPTSVAFSFILAIYWAAAVFNLSSITLEVIKTNFINLPNFKVSALSLTIIIVLWYVFKYINHTLKDFISLYLTTNDPTTAVAKSVMIFNVQKVIIWGIWIITALNIFKVNNTWIVVVSGGLSTGIGFAMKDILENIYYGISLMAGRIKIGDLIVCDGIRGKVSSINYTSTIIEGSDGSVIAFQNSQLFTKNYKNLTKNHGYELLSINVGVAYGTNIAKTRELLIKAIKKLDCIHKNKGVNVQMSSFDDSAITLQIITWVKAITLFKAKDNIMETIYNTLNDNGIEIPFPQREINLKHIENE